MIPTLSIQLISEENRTWQDDHFYLQAEIRKNPNPRSNDWDIGITANLSSLVFNDAVRNMYPEAANLPINKDIQSRGQIIETTNFMLSMLSGTQYLSVRTLDNKALRYFTMRRDLNTNVAPGALTVGSGFAGEHPLKTITKEGKEETGVYYYDRKSHTLKRVAFGEVAKGPQQGLTLLYPASPGTYREYDIGNTLNFAEWKKMFDQQKADITKQINKKYPQFADVDLDKTEPVLATNINSLSYSNITLRYETPDSDEPFESTHFKAFAYYQQEFNSLNLARVAHIDLPCKDEDLIIIDNERFGREAKLLTLEQLKAEDKKLSFVDAFTNFQDILVQSRIADKQSVLHPV